MAVQPTYPGVYVQALPSGVRTITGVKTSVTGFIGKAVKGPLNKATTITSFADFEKKFGGLEKDCMMSYAVSDFYQNGGSEAVIVRIAKDSFLAKESFDTEAGNQFIIQAIDEGDWGNDISILINQNINLPPNETTPNNDNLFNIIVFYKDLEVEKHIKVSLDTNHSRFLPNVLKSSSTFIKVDPSSISGFLPDVVTSKKPLQGGSNGDDLTAIEYKGLESNKTGLFAFIDVDLLNLLCVPPPLRDSNTFLEIWSEALKICVSKRAILIIDSPIEWGDTDQTNNVINGLSSLGIQGIDASHASIYFPQILKRDFLCDNQIYKFAPCGLIAGLISKNDVMRGFWKAPAGIDMGINGIKELQYNLTDQENGLLNPIGVNCLRNLPGIGKVVWGSRTMRGADIFADEYKYLPVKRTKLFILESLYRGLQWTVFEPNYEPLWAQIRLNVGAFMHSLYAKGAFQGKKNEAYFVKCDTETTTQTDINNGIVNIVVGFAPLKPAEFVIISLQQMAGNILV